MNFEKWIAWWQITGFMLMLFVMFSCMFSLYILAHQLFYTYRLLTAGPCGFEQAAIFYLARTMTLWRHLAIKALLNGLWLFLFSVGITLFVKCIKDGSHGTGHQEYVVVLNVKDGTSTNEKVAHVPMPGHELDMTVHTGLAIGILALFWCFTLFLLFVRRQHTQAFQECHHHAQVAQQPLLNTHRQMVSRGYAGGASKVLDT